MWAADEIAIGHLNVDAAPTRMRHQSEGASSNSTLVDNDFPSSSSSPSPTATSPFHTRSRPLNVTTDPSRSDFWQQQSSPLDSELTSFHPGQGRKRRGTLSSQKSTVELGSFLNKIKCSRRCRSRGNSIGQNSQNSNSGRSEDSEENDDASVQTASFRASNALHHKLSAAESSPTAHGGGMSLSGYESPAGNNLSSDTSVTINGVLNGTLSDTLTTSKKDRKLFRRSLSLRSVSNEKLRLNVVDSEITGEPTGTSSQLFSSGSEVNLSAGITTPTVSDSNTTNAQALFSASPTHPPSQSFKRKNKELHRYFKSLSETEYYVEDYGCALQKDILIQGRLYLTDAHFCFYANIFGFVTTLLIPLDQVVSLEKKMTAKIFPNAIAVVTEKTKYLFASFLVRDQAYAKMDAMWQQYKAQHKPAIPFNINNEEYIPDGLSRQASVSTAFGKPYVRRESSTGVGDDSSSSSSVDGPRPGDIMNVSDIRGSHNAHSANLTGVLFVAGREQMAPSTDSSRKRSGGGRSATSGSPLLPSPQSQPSSAQPPTPQLHQHVAYSSGTSVPHHPREHSDRFKMVYQVLSTHSQRLFLNAVLLLCVVLCLGMATMSLMVMWRVRGVVGRLEEVARGTGSESVYYGHAYGTGKSGWAAHAAGAEHPGDWF